MRMGQGKWCPKGWEHGKFFLPFPLAYVANLIQQKQTNERHQERIWGTAVSLTPKATTPTKGQTTISDSPQYMVQDCFHLFKLHGDTSVKFIILILLMLLIALAAMLMWRKRKGLTGRLSTKLPIGSLAHPLMKLPTDSFYPPLTNTQWVDQRDL